MVPATLYLVRGTDFHTAKAVSLLVIVGSAGVGIWTHHQERSVDFRKGALLALGGFAGAVISVLLVEHLTDAILTALFGVVLAITGLRLTRSSAPKAHTMTPRQRSIYLLGLGVLAGSLSGALGVGGGIVMVPGMVLAGMGMHLAVGTSLVAVLGNAAGATLSHLALGYGPSLLSIGLPLAAGAIPGTYLGARLAHKLRADRLRRLFGAGLILVGAWMLTDAVWV
jgi:hypothetical protein